MCIQVESGIDLNCALHLIVEIVSLGGEFIGVHTLPQDVRASGYVCDVNPLAVEMLPIHITTAGRDSLGSGRAPKSCGVGPSTETVFEAEASLVPLCDFLSRGHVQEVIVHEGLKRVIVVMTGVPYPFVGL